MAYDELDELLLHVLRQSAQISHLTLREQIEALEARLEASDDEGADMRPGGRDEHVG